MCNVYYSTFDRVRKLTFDKIFLTMIAQKSRLAWNVLFDKFPNCTDLSFYKRKLVNKASTPGSLKDFEV